MTLNDRLFCFCSSLQSVSLPAGITSVPYRCFWACRALCSVTIPEGVSSVLDGAFYNCFKLSSIELPDSLISIGNNAFHACLSLETVALTADVTDIHENAFSDCDWLVLTAPEGSVGAQYAVDHGLVPEDQLLGSPHPYTDDDMDDHVYTGPTGAAALRVTFSYMTYVNGLFGADELIVTDGFGNSREYTGDALSGKTLVLPGDTFTVTLMPIYASGQDFGFRVTSRADDAGGVRRLYRRAQCESLDHPHRKRHDRDLRIHRYET